MSTRNTERAEPEAARGRTETDRRSRTRRLLPTAGWPTRRGLAAALAGGVLLAGAVRSASRRERRAGLLAAVGGTLLLVGLRRLRTADESTAGGEGEPAHHGGGPTGVEGDREVSAEAGAHRDRSDVLHQPEANPRGVSGEPDVETKTDPASGDVRFTAEQDEGTGPKPDLEEPAADDPRRSDATGSRTPDDHVEIDLSEAAMADEASEATGPDPEQAYPASEGTDPEPTSPEAPDAEAEASKTNAESDGDGVTDDGTRASEDDPEADGDEPVDHDEEST